MTSAARSSKRGTSTAGSASDALPTALNRRSSQPVVGVNSQWRTALTERTVLAVVHNVTAATRLLDVLPLVAADQRIQTIFTVTGSSAFTAGTERFLLDRGVGLVGWDRVGDHRVDLAIAASCGGRLRDLQAPLIVLPHGMGYNKYLTPDSGLRTPDSARSPESVFGLSAEWLLDGGALIPSALVLSHTEQLARLSRSCPQAVDVAILAGDPCFDRLLASRPLRESYRRALGADDAKHLVTVSSTWGASSLIGRHPELVPRLAARLPLDDYAIALTLHPNVWYWHSPWQVRMWLADCQRAGVVLLPPDEGWRAALIAADLVVGDHGSVTFYGAALGCPVLLASTPRNAVDPQSPIGLLLAAAPRLDASRNVVEQIQCAIAEHDPALIAPIAALTTSAPGESARLLRSALYRMLDLGEPSRPVDTSAVPVPPAARPRIGAQLVHVHLGRTPDGGVLAEVVRYPAELLRIEEPLPPEAHLAVDTAEPYRRWLELADIIVVAQLGDAVPTLAAMPGCLLATAPHGAHEWVVVLRDGRSARFTEVTIDGRVCASIVHAWLTAGRALDELDGGVAVQLGTARAAVNVTVP